MKYNCAEKWMFDGLTKSRYDKSIPSMTESGDIVLCIMRQS